MSVLTAVDEADALEQLHRLGCTDGLPVVIPTPERVDRCVLATGADPTTSLGVMGPLGAATTIERVATNAVMAGCDPDHMPIVVATLRALLRPEYDLSEAQSTTHSTAPLVVVSGPLAEACGIAGGFGALGPGHRANASIGRAVRLCLMNIGGARPGRLRHGVARPARQVHDVPGREHRRVAVGAVLGRRRLRLRSTRS